MADSNIQRENVPLSEKANAVKRRVERPEKVQRECAEKFGAFSK